VERARRAPRTLLEQYRDDGPLARAIGAAGRLLAIPPFLLVGAGAAGLLTLVALYGADAADGVVALGVGWFVLLAGVSSGRPHGDRFAWSVPGLLRVGEYAALLWIGANAGDSGAAGAFALIAALTFRHYDLVYRPRYQGVAPPDWLQDLSGGWDGRLVVAWILLAVGALPTAMFVLAGVLGAVFAADCVMSWVRLSTRPLSVYDDEEDEGQ
jgi:hypothetical protein